jgi:hypothetical protein
VGKWRGPFDLHLATFSCLRGKGGLSAETKPAALVAHVEAKVGSCRVVEQFIFELEVCFDGGVLGGSRLSRGFLGAGCAGASGCLRPRLNRRDLVLWKVGMG